MRKCKDETQENTQGNTSREAESRGAIAAFGSWEDGETGMANVFVCGVCVQLWKQDININSSNKGMTSEWPQPPRVVLGAPVQRIKDILPNAAAQFVHNLCGCVCVQALIGVVHPLAFNQLHLTSRMLKMTYNLMNASPRM